MDIHRCRFVPYPPHCINALAFSHDSDTTKKSPKDLRLAIGRSNGDIELWNPQAGNWFQESIIRGARNRSVEGLVWTRDTQQEDNDASERSTLRLFSIGDSPSITEWDLAKGIPLRHANGNFGDIWCIAAQPRFDSQLRSKSKDTSSNTRSSQILAAGCQDGNIVLFSTEDSELRFLRSIGKPPTKKPKVLSIAWRDVNTIVAGYDDSMIRVFDIRNKASLRTMSLGKPAEGNETYVWCIHCLPDGSIISGDSSGELKIWDSRNYSLVQRLKTHKSDITDITISASGNKIVSVGVDRRTVTYQPISQQGQKKQRWTQVMHRRFHEHDVKAIVSFESKAFSVCVSGGVDTVPIVMPLQKWRSEYHRSLSHLPQKPQMSVASKARLMLTWWDCDIYIWRIKGLESALQGGTSELVNDNAHQLVARISLHDDENLTSAAISASGNFVLASTVAGVKLFQLRSTIKDNIVDIRTRRIDLPAALARSGAREVCFSPDDRWICAVGLDNLICLMKVSASSNPKERPTITKQVVKLRRRSREITKLSELGKYPRNINRVAFSTDSRILATANLSGVVDIWLLEGHEDKDLGVADTTNGRADPFASEESSDDDTDKDSDDEDEVVIHGQRWIRNPQELQLPQLGCGVLTMSFKPIYDDASSHVIHSNIGLHATRHTPHPIAHELPNQHQKLAIVTTKHEIVEFDALQGTLSDWSRRNPSNCFPRAFSNIKDRAMGCFWDSTPNSSRLWMYGTTWLFMLDLSKDLPVMRTIGRLGKHVVLEPVKNFEKKRKRSIEDVVVMPKRNTGAGDDIRQPDLYLGTGKHMQKFTAGDEDSRQMISVRSPTSLASDDEADMELRKSSLAAMRREDKDMNVDAVHNRSMVNDDIAKQEDQEATDATHTQSTRVGWWHTFHYRYIFGMIPVNTIPNRALETAKDNYEETSSMEVFLVERPLYEVDMPPRFDGGQDWDV